MQKVFNFCTLYVFLSFSETTTRLIFDFTFFHLKVTILPTSCNTPTGVPPPPPPPFLSLHKPTRLCVRLSPCSSLLSAWSMLRGHHPAGIIKCRGRQWGNAFGLSNCTSNRGVLFRTEAYYSGQKRCLASSRKWGVFHCHYFYLCLFHHLLPPCFPTMHPCRCKQGHHRWFTNWS